MKKKLKIIQKSFGDIKNFQNRNIPDSVNLNDVTATNGEETVNLFADHFKQIYNPTTLTNTSYSSQVILNI